jgi:hypothetical protein
VRPRQICRGLFTNVTEKLSHFAVLPKSATMLAADALFADQSCGRLKFDV